MKIVGYLSEPEKELFVDILFKFEGVVAFNESKMGKLDSSIEPLIVIPTVNHEPWQQQNLQLPKVMQDFATEHVRDKLKRGIF